MKKVLVLLLIATSVTTSFAQFGIRGTYSNVQTPNWEQVITDNLGSTDFNLNQIGFGADYWFRLKNQRIEFMPTLKYAASNTAIPHPSDGSNRVFDLKSIGLHWNTNIYFLDFKGDCDCPTWSKSEPWVEKGLFLFISPGVDYQSFNYAVMDNDDANAILEVEHKDLNFNIGAGLGLDIGISDLITITPYAGLRFHNTVEWGGFLSGAELANPLPSKMWQIYGGLRLGVRLDD